MVRLVVGISLAIVGLKQRQHVEQMTRQRDDEPDDERKDIQVGTRRLVDDVGLVGDVPKQFAPGRRDVGARIRAAGFQVVSAVRCALGFREGRRLSRSCWASSEAWGRSCVASCP